MCSALLCCALLCCAVLCCAVLCSAVRCCVVLCCAVLCGAVRCCEVTQSINQACYGSSSQAVRHSIHASNNQTIRMPISQSTNSAVSPGHKMQQFCQRPLCPCRDSNPGHRRASGLQYHSTAAGLQLLRQPIHTPSGRLTVRLAGQSAAHSVDLLLTAVHRPAVDESVTHPATAVTITGLIRSSGTTGRSCSAKLTDVGSNPSTDKTTVLTPTPTF